MTTVAQKATGLVARSPSAAMKTTATATVAAIAVATISTIVSSARIQVAGCTHTRHFHRGTTTGCGSAATGGSTGAAPVTGRAS